MNDFFTIKRDRKNKNAKGNIENEENEENENENENEDELEERLNDYKYDHLIFNDENKLSKYQKEFSKKKNTDSTIFFDVEEPKDIKKASNEMKRNKHSNMSGCMRDPEYNQIMGLNITDCAIVPDEIRHKYTKPYLFQIARRLLVMKQPWRLPKNVDLQTNNIDHVSNYIKVLERISNEYLNDPPSNYCYSGLELYNKNVFSNIDYLLKKVEVKNSEKNVNYSHLIKVNKSYYDLNTFGKSPSHIFYQSYIIWDIHGNNLTLSEEYDKYFESQILDYAFGEKEYPNLKYILNICSTILFWLNFNKKENFAIINYHKASSFVLLILSCVMLSLDNSLTFEQLQETLYKSSKIYNEQNNDNEYAKETELDMKMDLPKDMDILSNVNEEQHTEKHFCYQKREAETELTPLDAIDETYNAATCATLPMNNSLIENKCDSKKDEQIKENECLYKTPNNSYDSIGTKYLKECGLNSCNTSLFENEYLKQKDRMLKEKEIFEKQINISTEAESQNSSKIFPFYNYEMEYIKNKKKLAVLPNSWAVSLKSREKGKKNKKAKDHHFWIPFEYWKPSHKRYFKYFNELIRVKNKRVENNIFKLKSIIFNDYAPCNLSIEIYEIVFRESSYDEDISSEYESVDEEEEEEEEEEVEEEEKEEMDKTDEFTSSGSTDVYKDTCSGTDHNSYKEGWKHEEDEFKECFERKKDIYAKEKRKKEKGKRININKKQSAFYNTSKRDKKKKVQEHNSTSTSTDTPIHTVKKRQTKKKHKGNPFNIHKEHSDMEENDENDTFSRSKQFERETSSNMNEILKKKKKSAIAARKKEQRSSGQEYSSCDEYSIPRTNGTYPYHTKRVNSYCCEENDTKISLKKSEHKSKTKHFLQAPKNTYEKKCCSTNISQFQSVSDSLQQNLVSESYSERENADESIFKNCGYNDTKKKNFKSKWKTVKEKRYSFFSSDDSSNFKKHHYYNFIKQNLRREETDSNADIEETAEVDRENINQGENSHTKEKQEADNGLNEKRRDRIDAETENIYEEKKNVNVFTKRKILKKKKKIYLDKIHFQQNVSKANKIYNILKTANEKVSAKEKIAMKIKSKSKKKSTNNKTKTDNRGGYEYFLKCHSLSYNVVSSYEKNKKKYITIDFTHDAEGYTNEHIICGDILILMGHKNVEGCCTCFPCSYSFHTGFLKKGSSEIIEIRKKDIDISNNFEHYIPDDMKISIILESATERDALNAYKKSLKKGNKIEDLKMLKNFEKSKYIVDVSSESDKIKKENSSTYLLKLEGSKHFFDGTNEVERKENKSDRTNVIEAVFHQPEESERKNYHNINKKTEEKYKTKGSLSIKTKGITKPETLEEIKNLDEVTKKLLKIKSETDISSKLTTNYKTSYNSIRAPSNSGKDTKTKYNASSITLMISSFFGFRNKEEKLSLNNKQKMNHLLTSDKTFTNSISLKDYLKRQFDVMTKPSPSIINFVKCHIIKVDETVLQELSKITKLSKIFLRLCIKLCQNDFVKTLKLVLSMWGINILKMKQIKDTETLQKIVEIVNLNNEYAHMKYIETKKISKKMLINNTALENLHIDSTTIATYEYNKSEESLFKKTKLEDVDEEKKNNKRQDSLNRNLKTKYKNKIDHIQEEPLKKLEQEIQTEERYELTHLKDSEKSFEHINKQMQIALSEVQKSNDDASTEKGTTMEKKNKEEKEEEKKKEDDEKKDDEKKEDDEKKKRKKKEIENENENEKTKKTQALTDVKYVLMDHNLEKDDRSKIEKSSFKKTQTKEKSTTEITGEKEEEKIQITKHEEIVTILSHDKKEIKESSDLKYKALEKIEKTKFFYAKLPTGELIKLKIDDFTFSKTHDNMPLFIVESVDNDLKLSSAETNHVTQPEKQQVVVSEKKTSQEETEEVNKNKENTEEQKKEEKEAPPKKTETLTAKNNEVSKSIKPKRKAPPLPEKYKQMMMMKSASTAKTTEETNKVTKDAAEGGTIKEANKASLSKILIKKGGKIPPRPPPSLAKWKNSSPLNSQKRLKTSPMKCLMKHPVKTLNEKKIPEKRPLGIKLHWKLLPTHKIEGTVFSEIGKQETKYNLIDTKAVHKLFARIKEEKKTENKKKAEEKKKNNEEKLLTVLDRNRAQNVGILLRFPISTEEIAEKINSFNLDNMNIEFLQKVLHILPTKEESDALLAKLKQENVKPEHFRDVERKLIPFVHIERFKYKVEICLFSLKYDKMINEITADLNVYDKAVKEVRSSVRLRSLLKAVLKWGNYVNYGINENEDLVALGFTLSSVLKLTEFKSSIDNSITSLHYITVTLCMQLSSLNMSLLENDLKTVLVASKMSSEAVDILLLSLDKEMKFLKSQVQLDYEPYFKDKIKQILQDSEEKCANVQKMYEDVKKDVFSINRYLGEDTAGNGNLENIFIILTSIVNNFMKCYKDISSNPKKYSILLNDPNVADEYYNIFSKKKKNVEKNSDLLNKKEPTNTNGQVNETSQNNNMKAPYTNNTDSSNTNINEGANTNTYVKNEKFLFKNINANRDKFNADTQRGSKENKSSTLMIRTQLLKELQARTFLKNSLESNKEIVESCDSTNGHVLSIHDALKKNEQTEEAGS